MEVWRLAKLQGFVRKTSGAWLESSHTNHSNLYVLQNSLLKESVGLVLNALSISDNIVHYQWFYQCILVGPSRCHVTLGREGPQRCVTQTSSKVSHETNCCKRPIMGATWARMFTVKQEIILHRKSSEFAMPAKQHTNIWHSLQDSYMLLACCSQTNGPGLC